MMPIARPRPSFDALLERLTSDGVAVREEDVLQTTHWALGEDARLAEDPRFRPTPWGHWIPSMAYIANDALHDTLLAQGRAQAELRPYLAGLAHALGVPCAFCPGDARFVLVADEVRLAASQLSLEPAIEDDVDADARFATHLPVHDLAAVAASLPAGEWGAGAVASHVTPIGWLRVDLGGRRGNYRLFVGRIVGHSMDDGRSGLVDGAYAVFEAWPAGSRQGWNVLVRGAFRDPETGSYVVKRYEADKRDEEGRHHRIWLVSLNPDRERYPDIELDEDAGDDVAVIARVVKPLQVSDYARRPNAPRRTGRRDLTSGGALAAIDSHLAAFAERFFARSEAGDGPTEGAEGRPWRSRWVCLEAEAGGLHLEIGPLTGLWGFVRTLVGTAASGAVVRTLASNARQRAVRMAVPPASGSWTWVAEGFEDDVDLDLTPLDAPALVLGRPTLFRIGADGIGRVAPNGGLILEGHQYRLVVPPDVDLPPSLSPAAEPLADRWRLIELDLSAGIDEKTVLHLGALGVDIGTPAPRVTPSFVRPVDAWVTTEGGDVFPTFRAVPSNINSGPATTTVWLDVQGYDAEIDGEARLFIRDPLATTSVDLPAGASTVVEILDLGPGRYVAGVLHERTAVPFAQLPFVVAAEPPSPPAARVTIRQASCAVVVPAEEPLSVWRGDIAEIAHAGLIVEGPPGWPVDLRWRELADAWLKTIWLDAHGLAAGSTLLAAMGARWPSRAAGDAVLDFGELGSAVLEHEKRPTVSGVGASLRAIAAERGSMVRAHAGEYGRLGPHWFRPVTQILGYEFDATMPAGSSEPPAHVVAGRLITTERTPTGFRRATKRILVMVERLEPVLQEPLRRWISTQCHLVEVEVALISDGVAWSTYRRDSHLPLRVRHLDDLDAHDALVDFLRDMAAVI